MKRPLTRILSLLFEEKPQAQWSLLRIGLALSLLIDAIFKFQHAPEFYGSKNPVVRAETALALDFDSSAGVFLEDALQTIWSNDLWLYISEVALFAALIALGLGFHTRVAAAVAVLINELLNLRNPIFQYIGGSYSSILLLYIVLSPAGRYFSIRPSQKTTDPSSFVLTLAKLNISTAYLLTFSSKLMYPEWREGTALYYILNLDQLVRFASDSVVIQFIAESPPLVATMTYAVLVIQLMLFTLIWWPRYSTVIVSLGIGLHLAMIVFLRLGVIQLLSISALFLFLDDAAARRLLVLPATFWAKISKARQKTSSAG